MSTDAQKLDDIYKALLGYAAAAVPKGTSPTEAVKNNEWMLICGFACAADRTGKLGGTLEQFEMEVLAAMAATIAIIIEKSTQCGHARCKAQRFGQIMSALGTAIGDGIGFEIATSQAEVFAEEPVLQ